MTARSDRRGSVVVIALWAVALAALVASALQLSAFRQATVGREAVARAQARWAARAGLEYSIAVMAEHTQFPLPDDARAMLRDLENVAEFELHHAAYRVSHQFNDDTDERAGPMDEHAKLNVNVAIERGLLPIFEDMTFDVMDSARDWTDDDHESSGFAGVERDWYLSRARPYEPRNGTIRNIAEFELIAGVWPRLFRGEDWSLNGRLDPNEDDNLLTWPDYDNADGRLNGGWAIDLTASTVSGGATSSGEPRIVLLYATAEDLMDRLGIEEEQASELLTFGRNPDARIEQLIFADPSGGGAAGGATDPRGGAGAAPEEGGRDDGAAEAPAVPLSDEELRLVLEECVVQDPLDRNPGKMNVNFVPARLLRRLIEQLGMDPAIADEIIHLRSGTNGITSMLDLREIQAITDVELQTLTELFGTVSNVFTVSVVGRSASGQEVEIIAVVDRSTVPVKILEYREQ